MPLNRIPTPFPTTALAEDRLTPLCLPTYTPRANELANLPISNPTADQQE
jgi:hypothetical protein